MGQINAIIQSNGSSQVFRWLLLNMGLEVRNSSPELTYHIEGSTKVLSLI